MNDTTQASTPPALPAVKRTPGLALASLILGILSLLGFAALIIPTVLAIVFGHMAHSRIRKDPSLGGAGLAIAGFVMGYASIFFGIIMAGLMAAMAIPAFQKVRQTSLEKMMQNEARMIAGAAQQYMLEKDQTSVTFSIDPETGEISGPLADYIPAFTPGTREVDGTIESLEDTFSLSNPQLLNGREFIFDAEGTQRN